MTLLKTYPKSGVLLAGDANKMDFSQILRAAPHFRQIVTKPTHCGGILDIIITNMQPRYSVPVIRPPIRPDSSTQDKPSDHSVAVAVPVQIGDRGVTREYRTRTFRPTPESSREMFGNLLLTVSWDYVYLAKTSIDKVTKLDEMTNEMVEICFPEVTVKYNNQDLPYITAQLKKMARLKKKEFKKNGRSER